MKFRIYREHGALNSTPIFNALERGLRKLNHEIVGAGEDVAVIWSVLWQGRMKENQKIYQQCKKNNVPVMIVEVGNLLRGQTWRLSLAHINALGTFGNDRDLDPNRPKKLRVNLMPEKLNRKKEILIACQHQHSLQWEGMPTMADWCRSVIEQIRRNIDYQIVVRPHPRSLFQLDYTGVKFEKPRKISNTYDDFDIDYDYHCVINHNSGPAVQAAVQGIPVICDRTSLAHAVSDKIENIRNIALPSRKDWFLKICHSEWTEKEIEAGVPIERLLSTLTS